MAQPCVRHGGLPGRSDGVAGAAAVRRPAVGAAGGGRGPAGRGAELVAEGRAGGRPGGGDSAKGFETWDSLGPFGLKPRGSHERSRPGGAWFHVKRGSKAWGMA